MTGGRWIGLALVLSAIGIGALACSAPSSNGSAPDKRRSTPKEEAEGEDGDDDDDDAAPKDGTLQPEGTPDASVEGEEEDRLSPGADAGVPMPETKAGAELLTITFLNLRATAATTAAVLVQIPAGVRAKVVDDQAPEGWAHLTYDGKTGFAMKQFLNPGVYSAARGKMVAERSLALWDGKATRGQGLAGVDDAMETSGAIPTPPGWIPRQANAAAWQKLVNDTPLDLVTRGYVRVAAPLDKLPRGAILGWRPNTCGYGVNGYVEIVVDDASSKGCSDTCAPIKKTCGAPFVWMPVQK